MLTFLLEEGVLTVGAISGIFTSSLLGSFKSNILDPVAENILPSRHLDKDAHVIDTSGNPEYTKLQFGDTKSQFGSKIKWQTFLKDLVLWLLIMFIIYIIWKKLISNIKKP